MRLAVIPARGGSKRIPKKNIAPFCGKPMIAYALDAVADSGMFDKIHVSTDSEEIRDVVEKLGFPVDFMRDPTLADDYTGLVPVLRWVVEQYRIRGESFEQICCVMPTAPLIRSKDFVEAFKIFNRHHAQHPLLVVARFPVPIEWAFERAKGGVLKPLQQGMLAIRSQDLSPKYHDTGSFSIFSMNDILSSVGVGNNFNFVGYVLPKYKAIDIDTLDAVSYTHLTLPTNREV